MSCGIYAELTGKDGTDDMIDTVALLIPKDDFQIADYDAFSPSAKGLYEAPFYKGAHIKCTQQSSKGDYQPKLTLIKRVSNGGYSLYLKIEFSAPKLLLGNNFEELEDFDFAELINKLQKTLAEMGVNIELNALLCAKVVKVHYSKNIFLATAPTSLVIDTIKKLNLSKRLDVGSTDYRNEGQAIRYHTNSYELTFYDKIKDLEQAKISEKRAIEDYNGFNFETFYTQKLADKEVLRMEIRLNTAKNIKATLKKIGYNSNETGFGQIFSKQLSKTILMHFFNKYVNPSLPTLILAKQSEQEIYYQAKSLGMNENKALQIVGALKIINAEGFRSLRNALSDHAYYRIKAELERFEKTDNYIYAVFKQFRADLAEMESIRFQQI